MSTPRPLDALFCPRSVAVVGASRRRDTVGGAVFANLLKGGFQGPVYPVNPSSASVQSVRAWPTLESLPEVPELVVVAVPAPQVPGVVEAAARLGVGAAIVLTAGFREIGEAGRQAEAAIRATARGANMRLLGPNCLGAQNPDPKVRLDATFATTFAPDGGVAYASQSGALGLAALDYAFELGIGFSAFASLGNKADISGNDLLEHFEGDPRTKVVLLYLESLGNPMRFREIAGRVGRTKPIAMVKSGRSGSGARAAGSHTGALAGPDSAISALCAQAGVIRADTLEQLFDVAMVLANQPLPKGRRVAVVTNAGGPGILATDALEAAGLLVPRLSAGTEAALKAVLRPEASVQNPVDVLADSDPQGYGAAMRHVLEDPEVDAVVALYVPPVTSSAEAMAAAIVEAAARSDKPVLSCFMGSHGVPEALASLHRRNVPSFRFPEGAAKALALAVSYAEWREAPAASPEATPPAPLSALEALRRARTRLGAEGGWLVAGELADFARAWGLSLAPQRRVSPSPEAAEEAAAELGFPVVLKAEVDGLVHKTEAGAVALGLSNRAQVREAAQRMLSLEPRGLVVQQQISGGEEWLVGAVRDPHYGPLVAVGAGGTRAELWRDTCQRLAPLSSVDVEALLEQPRVGKTLHGFRGAPAGDRDALARLVRSLAAAACAHPDIAELELNPVKVQPVGKGAVAVDMRVHLARAQG
ncbi:MAG: acetate--CoA ligase family protein [Myxococcaceae bacterium]